MKWACWRISQVRTPSKSFKSRIWMKSKTLASVIKDWRMASSKAPDNPCRTKFKSWRIKVSKAFMLQKHQKQPKVSNLLFQIKMKIMTKIKKKLTKSLNTMMMISYRKIMIHRVSIMIIIMLLSKVCQTCPNLGTNNISTSRTKSKNKIRDLDNPLTWVTSDRAGLEFNPRCSR